ncbi:MAG TPA: ABC transporter permease [Gemmatimonadales bacterium]|jgi:putative ABC transport system permease protein
MSRLGRGNLFARGFEGVALAVDALRANKVRAALTILGIAIGVMVVIAMASTITGIQNSVSEVVSRAGPTSFYVLRHFQSGIQFDDQDAPWRHWPRVTRDEAEMIRRLPDIGDVNITEQATSTVSHGSVNLGSVNVSGMDVSWLKVGGGVLLEGRNFTPVDEAASSYVVVLNDKAAEVLLAGVDPIGKVVKIFGLPFTVVGLYQDPSGLFSQSSPHFVVPHTTFVKSADYQRGFMQIIVFPRPEITQADAMDQVTTALRVRRGLKPGQDNTFALVAGDKLLENFNNITAGFFLVMLALSSVGLMVGGVGVVAIMMISVTERTREIGVRKALGATHGEILFQFLVEAATLTVVGGICGLVLGALIALAVNHLTPIPAAIPLWSVVAAILASAVTGIFFGLYPANKAAGLDPVDALRYE